MSSHNKKVMSLEDKVRIIRKFEALKNPSDKNSFIKSNGLILINKSKILSQYDDMKAKLAAVRDLVIAEYGKPNYLAEKHAFLQKIMVEWYRRAIRKLRKVSVALLCHNTDVAMRILNITGLPLSESQISALKRNCHQASLQRSSTFDESTTLCIRKIAQEMLTQMGISKARALSVYGPGMFQEGRDENEDGVELLRRFYVGNCFGKRKLKQKERPSNKSPRASNEKHVPFGYDTEGELNRGDLLRSEGDEEGTDATQSNDCIWPYDVAIDEDNENEEEDFEIYDVVSVVDSTEEFDAATSGMNSLPECTTDIAEETVVPCTVVKTEPDEGQPANWYSTDAIAITDVRERVAEWLIKKECEATEGEGNSQEACATLGPIKIEGVADQMANCEHMSTCFQDCVKQGTEEASSDRDDDGLVHLYTVASEDSFDADSATSSTKNPICVYSDQDALRTLELLKGFLQKQQNRRALEALAKVEAAFLSSEKSSQGVNV